MSRPASFFRTWASKAWWITESRCWPSITNHMSLFALLKGGNTSADCRIKFADFRSISQRKREPIGMSRHMLSTSFAARPGSQTKFLCSLGIAKRRSRRCWRSDRIVIRVSVGGLIRRPAERMPNAQGFPHRFMAKDLVKVVSPCAGLVHGHVLWHATEYRNEVLRPESALPESAACSISNFSETDRLFQCRRFALRGSDPPSAAG